MDYASMMHGVHHHHPDYHHPDYHHPDYHHPGYHHPGHHHAGGMAYHAMPRSSDMARPRHAYGYAYNGDAVFLMPPMPPMHHHRVLDHHAMLHAKHSESKPRLAKDEVEMLENEYQKNNKPSSQRKREIAEVLKVDVPRINNWFQNRRAKAKQLLRREADPQRTGDESPSASSPSEAHEDGVVSEYYGSSQQSLPLRASSAAFPVSVEQPKLGLYTTSHNASPSTEEYPSPSSADLPYAMGGFYSGHPHAHTSHGHGHGHVQSSHSPHAHAFEQPMDSYAPFTASMGMEPMMAQVGSFQAELLGIDDVPQLDRFDQVDQTRFDQVDQSRYQVDQNRFDQVDQVDQNQFDQADQIDQTRFDQADRFNQVDQADKIDRFNQVDQTRPGRIERLDQLEADLLALNSTPLDALNPNHRQVSALAHGCTATGVLKSPPPPTNLASRRNKGGPAALLNARASSVSAPTSPSPRLHHRVAKPAPRSPQRSPLHGDRKELFLSQLCASDDDALLTPGLASVASAPAYAANSQPPTPSVAQPLGSYFGARPVDYTFPGDSLNTPWPSANKGKAIFHFAPNKTPQDFH